MEGWPGCYDAGLWEPESWKSMKRLTGMGGRKHRAPEKLALHTSPAPLPVKRARKV